MENINCKSSNIPKPVLKRQTAGLYKPIPVLKRQTNKIIENFDVIDIPRPVLKRQTNEVVQSSDDIELPIFYPICDVCTLLTITRQNNIDFYNAYCTTCMNKINIINEEFLDK